MNKLKIKVILGSIREGRNGEKVAKNVMDVLSKRDDAEYELLDLLDYPMPLFNDAVSPSMRTEPYSDKHVALWQSKIAEADGYIFITAEYNRGVPSVLKNAIDYLYPEWNKKAMAVISYGNAAGGSRAAEQLRTYAIELQMAPIRVGVHIPFIWEKFDSEGKLTDAHFEKSVSDQADQLIWWSQALKSARG